MCNQKNIPLKKLITMNYNGNPSKKPRWDDDFFNNDGQNEDLWGDGELTAEEFDFVENQATQRIQEDTSASCSVACNKPDAALENQYALEGQVKLLSDSLDKTIRELNVERINREDIIAGKIAEYKEKEIKLQKELEKMKSQIQFKDQEIKSNQSRLQSAEKKSKIHSNQASPSKSLSPNIFSNRFNFNAKTKSCAVQTVESEYDANQLLRIPLLFPEGDPSNSDMVSNFLANRINSISDKATNFTPLPLVPFARLNAGHTADELWYHFDYTLKEHISFLQQYSSSQTASKSPLVKSKRISLGTSQVSPSHHARVAEELQLHHSAVMTCFKDLRLFHPQAKDVPSSNMDDCKQELLKLTLEQDLQAYSCPLFTDDEKVDSASQQPPFMLSLFALAKPDTYPDAYCHKNEELYEAISTIVEWSTRNYVNLDRISYIIPFHILISSTYGLRCTYMALMLLSVIIPGKCIDILLHNGNCLFSAMANLCQNLNPTQGKEYAKVVCAVQNVLAEWLTAMGPNCVNDEECPCSSQLSQGIVIMLWRYCETCKRCFESSNNCESCEATDIVVLKQGVLLLHQLFTKIKDFEGKKAPVQDEYILLVCQLSKLSKKNSHFKSLQDTVHDLWDFQQDISDDTDEHIGD